MNSIPQVKYFGKNGIANASKKRSRIWKLAQLSSRMRPVGEIKVAIRMTPNSAMRREVITQVFKLSCYMRFNRLATYNRCVHALLAVTVALSLSVSGCNTPGRNQLPWLSMAPISDDLRGDPTSTIEVTLQGLPAWVLMDERVAIPSEEIVGVECSPPEMLGRPSLINIVFKQTASSKLKRFSEANLRRQIAIFVGDEIIATPLVIAVVTNELQLEFGVPESYERALAAIRRTGVQISTKKGNSSKY
jgi:hypothetical protein